MNRKGGLMELEKGKAVELLKEHSFEASIEDNLLYVHLIVKSQKELNRQAQEIDKILKENGFNSSYGWKCKFA